MDDKDFDPANMTPEQEQAYIESVGQVMLANSRLAQEIAAMAALAEIYHKMAEHGSRFKAMLGSEITITERVKTVARKLGITAIFNKMGLLPFAGRPQCAANVTCFYTDENGAVFILVGKKGDSWLTPQGFMDSVTPAIDDPTNKTFDFSLEDTAKRELLQEGGVDADKEGSKIFEAACLPRRMNPGGNDMIIRPSAMGVALSGRPEMGETDGTFERLEWVPLSHFRGDGDKGKTFLLSDGQETGTMPDLPEGLPYEFIISEVMKKHLDRVCLAAVKMNAEGVASLSSAGAPVRPEYMTGKQGQAYISAVIEGIPDVRRKLESLHTPGP